MKRYVFDSWAILAWLQGERPADATVDRLLRRVQALKAHGAMSWIQVGEVCYQVERRGGVDAAHRVVRSIESMGVKLDLPSRESILAAASWKAKSKISYADGFLVELGVRHEAALVTGDREILELAASGAVQLEWLGAKV